MNPCLTTRISYDKMTHIVDEKAVNFVHLYLSKAFDTFFHSLILEKLAALGLYRCTLAKKLAAWLGPNGLCEWI